VTTIDVPTGQIIARVSATGAGLTSVATSRGLAYAVNTATHEMAVLEPFTQSVSRYPLSEEPAAVTASEDSGAVYVLSSRSNVILQIDPTSGFELGRVLLSSRSGHPALRANGSQSMRPRMVLNVADQMVFASLPDSGSLAAVNNEQFPTTARVIPFLDVSDQGFANSIPGLLQPAAEALPSQPGPSQTLRAQAPDEQATPLSDEEGL
jgi:DNA-binding beta-propeller fold protein YncE